METLDFVNILIDAISDKKASDILLLNVREQSIIADYFLICSGESDRQIKAIMTTVIDEAKLQAKRIRRGLEGKPEDGWVLVDFGEVLVHVFSQERREYYDLEELWNESQVVVRMA